MAFAITGFGGEQLRAAPQIFQALSVGGSLPAAPAPPYGTPNPALVPVLRSSSIALPANLTVIAAPVFQAILNLGVVGTTRPGIASPANSTAALGATNPGILEEVLGPIAGAPVVAAPQGPVSFTLTASPAASTGGLQTLLSAGRIPSGKPDPPASDPQPASAPSTRNLPSSNPALLSKITTTVAQLAVSAVYPASVFSFSA